MQQPEEGGAIPSPLLYAEKVFSSFPKEYEMGARRSFSLILHLHLFPQNFLSLLDPTQENSGKE